MTDEDNYIVYFEYKGDELESEYFTCFADNAQHAVEQAINAYPQPNIQKIEVYEV